MIMKTCKWILSVLVVLVVAVDVKADCNGFSTPVRTALAERPHVVACIIAKLRAARAPSCSSGERAAASCSGPVQAASCSSPISAPSCSQSVISVATAPVPTFVIEAVPLCENGRCDIVRNTTARLNSGARFHSGMTSAYEQALASAQFRAANRIKGHTYLDTHRTSGVGWSSGNPNPNTCLGIGGNYASVKGDDGWYSTKIE